MVLKRGIYRYSEGDPRVEHGGYYHRTRMAILISVTSTFSDKTEKKASIAFGSQKEGFNHPHARQCINSVIWYRHPKFPITQSRDWYKVSKSFRWVSYRKGKRAKDPSVGTLTSRHLSNDCPSSSIESFTISECGVEEKTLLDHWDDNFAMDMLSIEITVGPMTPQRPPSHYGSYRTIISLSRLKRSLLPIMRWGRQSYWAIEMPTSP